MGDLDKLIEPAPVFVGLRGPDQRSPLCLQHSSPGTSLPGMWPFISVGSEVFPHPGFIGDPSSCAGKRPLFYQAEQRNRRMK